MVLAKKIIMSSLSPHDIMRSPYWPPIIILEVSSDTCLILNFDILGIREISIGLTRSPNNDCCR